MSYSYAVTSDHPLCGTWFAVGTSLFQNVQYTISVVEKQFRVTGIDWTSGEQMVICDIAFDGEWIRFQSLQPSSGRSGCNWMRVVDHNKIEFRFTFTDRELWAKKPIGKGNAVTARGPGARRISGYRKLVPASAAG